MIEYFQILYTKNGVHFLTEPESDFEKTYLESRKREGWLYTDEQVKTLPYVAADGPHASIWRLRLKSLNRFVEYVRRKDPPPRLMIEIGCGNGWFSRRLAERLHGTKIFGLDINRHELLQASRVFGNVNPTWLYGNLFKISWPGRLFDLVFFNGSLQYFPDISSLFDRILPSLVVGGEIHVLDSPFYLPEEKSSAQKRTELHYRQLGVPAMVSHYHAHAINDLAPYRPQLLYDPTSATNRLKRMAGIRVNPMPWIRLRPFSGHALD